jgi:hypothetical protein
MMKFVAQLSCGCCFTEMSFRSKKSAETAFQKAGLNLEATIVDDKGKVHEGVDTFYGYFVKEKRGHQ